MTSPEPRPQGSAPTRRTFLSTTGLAAAGAALPLRAPLVHAGHGRADEPLRTAHVGVGGMGGADLGSVASSKRVQVTALCDVDAKRLAGAAAKHAGAKTYVDYRTMLREAGDGVDAVVISTPDHMHAPIALAAMELGKHVYVQKPLAHDLYGCRRMREVAAERGVVTQMGTQIHATPAYRTAIKLLQDGVIGKVREVHSWVSKSWAGPKGGRPTQQAADGTRTERQDPVPTHVDWDRWLGVAPVRPYVQGAYHPAQWRGWADFGCGTLGDMACHLFDPVFSALDLRVPKSVLSKGPAHTAEVFAADSDVQYVFAGTPRTTDEVMLRWTDGRGSARPAKDRAQLPEGVNLPGAGSFLVGEDGVLVLPHWALPTVYRNGEKVELDSAAEPAGNHYHEWVDACLDGTATSTPFEFSTAVTEAVLTGVVAGRFPGRKLDWDSENLRFANDAEAQQLVRRPWRREFGGG